jgi:hypothetical protein
MLRNATRAIALAVLAGVLLVGCGPERTDSADTEKVAHNAARLGELYRRIMGNVAERTAGERLAYHGLQDPIQQCATAAGLPDLRPPFVNIYAGRTDADLTVAFFGDGWLTPLAKDSFGRAADQLRLAQGQPGTGPVPADQLSQADRDRYVQIQDSCEPPASAYTNVQYPAGATELNQALDDMIVAVESRKLVRDLIGGYQGCMKEAGFADIATPTALSQNLSSGSPPRDAMPLEGRQPSDAWLAFVEREQKAARADASCRRAVYNSALGDMGGDLDRFESDHASAIADVRRGWTDLTDRASKLGA